MEPTTEGGNPPSRQAIMERLWKMPPRPLARGAWLWWFWLFFIHDEQTHKTGKCRQIMILWSVKPERRISCNGLELGVPKPVSGGEGRWELQGAAAAWYYDGQRMHENFVLEPSKMRLDARERSLEAPGKTPSKFWQEGEEFITSIQAQGIEFELRAKQTDFSPVLGPTEGSSPMPLGMEVAGTRLERMELGGWEKGADGKRRKIVGTAYLQKILLAAPPPQWYWGIYHFADGSMATYMQAYAGRAMLADNMWPHRKLRKPSVSLKEDMLVYHAPSGRVFEGHQLTVKPREGREKNCWAHALHARGPDFELEGEAEGYAHACWSFKKPLGGHLPAWSTFRYNEYPSVLKRLRIKTADGESMVLENGWGNMENAWGFIL
ncbi:Uncharacterised protein [uncultured archaeon]|nr:Uncharacterised protein [uncultured archaeon]